MLLAAQAPQRARLATSSSFCSAPLRHPSYLCWLHSRPVGARGRHASCSALELLLYQCFRCAEARLRGSCSLLMGEQSLTLCTPCAGQATCHVQHMGMQPMMRSLRANLLVLAAVGAWDAPRAHAIPLATHKRLAANKGRAVPRQPVSGWGCCYFCSTSCMLLACLVPLPRAAGDWTCLLGQINACGSG